MLGFTKFKINRLVNRRELYSNFSYNKWNQLDTGSKWKCLQQLENHFAAEQGRPAVKVLPISSKEARGAYGGYDPDKNVIYINRDLVEYGTLVGPVDINHPTQLDANMQLFDTIAHEGYHAYQGYAIKHPGFHKDMKQVKEWAINDRNVKYFRRGDEYLVQPRERDAWKYGSEKTREAFDEIEKYYGTEPGRAMYEKSVEDNSYENAFERLWNNNPDALNQMYKEMMDAYEERYRENNSTVNLDPITVDEYDAISREAVNRYYEHLKNNPSLSNEDVMRMTGDMSEKYFSAVEEYKNAVQQKEKSEDRGEKENRTEKYEAQNPENRSIFNPDRVSVEEYDKTLRDQVNKYYEHLKNDPSLSNEDVMRMTEEMSEKYLTAVEEYRNAQKQEDEGFQEKSGESTEKRYKKEEIEKENPEHKRDVENQRKEEVEEENKSEKKDKLENREDEKDYEEEGAENKDKTETLSEDELEEERWNESESEDEAELLSDKAEAGEEQNAEDKAVTETESELQDNAADLSSEESSGETEDNSETEDNVEDLSSEESSEETEDESEKEDKDEDLSSEEGTEETEDESEKEDKAENLSGEESSEETEDESEEEDEAEDLSSGEGTEETEDESEKEDKAEDLSGEESSEETEDESEEEDKAEDLSSEKSSGGIEDNSEEEDKAEDLSGEESSGKIEDESEEEDEAKDLSSEENSGETEDNSEEEDKAEDLSSGEDDSTSYESGGNEEDENYSY